MKSRVVLFFICLHVAFRLGAAENTSSPESHDYDVPQSTLEALDRKLGVERRPSYRVDLLLRWIKIKETFETQRLSKKGKASSADEFKERPEILPSSSVPEKMDAYRGFKQEIIEKLNREIPALELNSKTNLDRLYRELAFRYLELQKPQNALAVFQKIRDLTTSDSMGVGDAYFALNQMPKALEAYQRGFDDPKWKVVAAYKRAWAYMSMAQFEKSLGEFDSAFVDDKNTPSKLREEAYRDRLRPFVEVYKKEAFDGAEAEFLKNLASKIFEKNSKKAKDLYLEALKILIELFNSKARIAVAQSVFEFVKRESSDAEAVLLQAVPLWIKVYRGGLDHPNVERILGVLPDKALAQESSILQGELYNTIVFYDNLLKEDQDRRRKGQQGKVQESDSFEAEQRCLFLANKKYFTLFPRDKNADPLRLGYAQILLDANQPEDCLSILSFRGGQDAELEKLAASFEAKCELKLLDDLYQKGISDRFKKKLHSHLIEKKIYLRSDLGFSSDQAFETLARMLIGALKIMPSDGTLREILSSSVKEELLTKNIDLKKDLGLLEAELRFVDIAKSSMSNEEKASQFFEIYLGAPAGLEIKKKALVLSIQLTAESVGLERCDHYKMDFPNDFKNKENIFDRCILLADRHFDLEREQVYLAASWDVLDDVLKIKLGLLEMALGKESGRKKLSAIRSESAKRVLDVWSDHDDENTKDQDQARKVQALSDRVSRFRDALKPIRFSQIPREVPYISNLFDNADRDCIRAIKENANSWVAARGLLCRSELASAMAAWMKDLPTPPKLSETAAADYNRKAQEIVKPWLESAEARKKDCGQLAYRLSEKFRSEDPSLCPFQENPAEKKTLLAAWEKTRQSPPPRAPWTGLGDKVQTADRLLEQGRQEKNPLKAKYHFIRVFERAVSNYERAQAFLGLARISNRASFWEAAFTLDGNILEAVEWKRKQSEGNPYYSALYDAEITELRGTK